MKNTMKTLRVFILAVLAIASAACNTMQGLGKDIEKGGQAIEKAANK
jgi:predicted small secreted protein